MIGRAFTAEIAQLHIHNPRDFAKDRYRKVDDEPYGGGVGRVLKPEPIYSAYESIPLKSRSRTILLTVLLSMLCLHICHISSTAFCAAINSVDEWFSVRFDLSR